MPRRKVKPLYHELFKIYKIQRLLFIELGLICIGAGLMPLFERTAPHATITNFGNSVWWALVTVTATGYGDFVPVTWEGKVIGTVLMFSGIILFSTMVALVASYFSYRRIKRNTIRTNRQIEDLTETVANLEKKINYLVKNGVEEE